MPTLAKEVRFSSENLEAAHAKRYTGKRVKNGT